MLEPLVFVSGRIQTRDMSPFPFPFTTRPIQYLSMHMGFDHGIQELRWRRDEFCSSDGVRDEVRLLVEGTEAMDEEVEHV